MVLGGGRRVPVAGYLFVTPVQPEKVPVGPGALYESVVLSAPVIALERVGGVPARIGGADTPSVEPSRATYVLRQAARACDSDGSDPRRLSL